jgi:hypothetical protein
MTGKASSAIAIRTRDGKVEFMRFESQYRHIQPQRAVAGNIENASR